MDDATRLDTILRIAIAVMLVVILAFGGFFGYTVYRDRKAAEDAIPAIRLSKTLQGQVREHPNDAVLRVRYGEALGAAGKDQEAIEQFNAALKIDPKHTGAYLDLGIVAMSAGRYDEAKSFFEKVVELTEGTEMAGVSDRRETALFNLGVLAFQQKKYDEAIGQFKAALRIRRDASDTYMYLAQSLEAIGQNADAEINAGYAVRFDPSFAQAHYLLGKLYLADGRRLEASQEVGRARELAPDSPEPKQLAEKIGDPKELYKQAVADAESKPEAAIEAATIAFNLDRRNNIAAAKLAGKLMVANGEKAEALKLYRRAAELVTDDAEINAAIEALTKKTKKKSSAKKK